MISTGLKKLDEFLSGGIPDGIIVDIFGGSGTGKTQLLLQISKKCIIDGGNVLYFDTTGSFRPERILELQTQNELNSNFLEKITVSRITNTAEQIKSIQNIGTDFSLIVIDNVTDLFTYEYSKDEKTFEKNSIFMNYMKELSNLALSKNIPIVVTNMIRNFEDKEIENMKSAIDPYTHIKIHLFKKSSKFTGIIYWALNKMEFSYSIQGMGVSNSSEDI